MKKKIALRFLSCSIILGCQNLQKNSSQVQQTLDNSPEITSDTSLCSPEENLERVHLTAIPDSTITSLPFQKALEKLDLTASSLVSPEVYPAFLVFCFNNSTTNIRLARLTSIFGTDFKGIDPLPSEAHATLSQILFGIDPTNPLTAEIFGKDGEARGLALNGAVIEGQSYIFLSRLSRKADGTVKRSRSINLAGIPAFGNPPTKDCQFDDKPILHNYSFDGIDFSFSVCPMKGSAGTTAFNVVSLSITDNRVEAGPSRGQTFSFLKGAELDAVLTLEITHHNENDRYIITLPFAKYSFSPLKLSAKLWKVQVEYRPTGKTLFGQLECLSPILNLSDKCILKLPFQELKALL